MTVIRDHLPTPGPERDRAIQNALRVLITHQPTRPAPVASERPAKRTG
ncbi:hypothetical protein [Deinococcus frigens]|nr:hypothetical protein [Deinococcus frigens]